MANHLVGLKQTYIKMSFLNMTDLQKARKDLLSAVRKNKERLKNASAYQEMLSEAMSSNLEGKCDSNLEIVFLMKIENSTYFETVTAAPSNFKTRQKGTSPC